MQAQHLLTRNGEQPERKIVAQVGLGREREAGEVGERLAMVGRHPGGVELGAHMRDFRVGARQRVLEALTLQRLELGARHGLGGAVEHEAVGGRAGHGDVPAPIRRRPAAPPSAPPSP